MKIVLATNNAHKVSEYKDILKEFDIQVLTLNDLNINCNPLENGQTFKENSLIKAKEIAKFTDLTILSDDSGLTINSLPDILGVYSSRFLDGKSYYEKCQEIIKLLENKPRDAFFSCVITLYNFKGNIYQFEGQCFGNIANKYQGENGFGYDPIFIPNGYKQTFAMLSSKQKSEISHRGIACKKLINFLKENC